MAVVVDLRQLRNNAVSHWPLTIAILGIGVVVYYTLLVIYRLTLHPLARYPGPVLARATDWYNVWQCWHGDRHIDFYRLHQKYGPVVRYGPSRISINSATASHAIYNRKANVQKSSYYSIFSHYFKAPSVLTSITARDHGRKRRIVGQGLSDTAISAMEGHVLKHVRNFCENMMLPDKFRKEIKQGAVSEKTGRNMMEGGWSPAKNVSRWSSYLTFDIMGDLCFSNTFEMLEDNANHYMLDVLPAGVQGLNVLGHMQGLAKLHLDRIIFPKLVSANHRYEAFSAQQASKRIANKDKSTRDVFYFLENGRDPETGEAFTLSELVSEASLLIVGGTDTTATAISSTIFYLLHNAPALEKVTAEILTAFPPPPPQPNKDASITNPNPTTKDVLESIRGGPVLTSLSYLRACIDESLRMSPGVGGILPREVLPGGIDIDGEHFPAGIDVGVPIYAIQHNEKYYPRPFEFVPERWIVSEPSQPELAEDTASKIGTAENVSLAKSAFSAFGVGPRGCVGRSMAYKEITIVIARLIWLYEMRLSPGRHEGEGDPSRGVESGRHRRGEYQGIDKFVLQVDGPWVEFRSRWD